MKKNSVLTKILCVFKPKKMPCDIVTEAENIINSYISNDDFTLRGNKNKKTAVLINTIIIFTLAAAGYVAIRYFI